MKDDCYFAVRASCFPITRLREPPKYSSHRPASFFFAEILGVSTIRLVAQPSVWGTAHNENFTIKARVWSARLVRGSCVGYMTPSYHITRRTGFTPWQAMLVSPGAVSTFTPLTSPEHQEIWH